MLESAGRGGTESHLLGISLLHPCAHLSPARAQITMGRCICQPLLGARLPHTLISSQFCLLEAPGVIWPGPLLIVSQMLLGCLML